MADDRPGSADDPGASSSLTTDAFRAVFGGPDHDRLPVLLLTLTMLSGVIDATSVIDLGHVFVANMTGNLVFIGIGLLATPDYSLTAALVPLGGFVLGVEGCRLLAARRPGRLMLLRDGLIGQAALLVVTTGLCAVAAGKPVGAIRYAVLAVAAVAMGGQNGLARRMGVNELTTTVMTGTVTALVSGRREREGRVASLRLTFSVVSLIAGALLGTAVVRVGHSTPALGLCAAIAVAVAVGASRQCASRPDDA